MKFLVLFLFCFSFLFAEENSRILNLSVSPAEAEIYIENQSKDFSENPDFISPAKIIVPKKKEKILITVFKKDFKDSSLLVSIPKIPESHLMVILQEETNQEKLDEQKTYLNKRFQKKVAKKMMFASILPLGIALTSGIFSLYSEKQMDDIQKDLKKHKIYTERTKKLENDFETEKEDAKKYRTLRNVFTGIGVGILGFSLYLYF